MVLCCGGIIASGIFAAVKGVQEVSQNQRPFTEEFMHKASKGGYQVAAVEKDLVPEFRTGESRAQLQKAFDIYKERLGKFEGFTSQTGMSFNNENGVQTSKTTYNAKFEKGEGTLTIGLLATSEGNQVLSINIVSDQLK